MSKLNKITFGGWCMLLYSTISIGLPLLITHLGSTQPTLYKFQPEQVGTIVLGNSSIHFLLFFYAILPLLLVPGAISIYHYFKKENRMLIRISTAFALMGINALVISLLIFPTANWVLLSSLQTISFEHKQIIIMVMQALNLYFSTGIGDILGLGSISIWLMITSYMMLNSKVFPSYFGLVNFVVTFVAVLILFLYLSNIVSARNHFIQIPTLFAIWNFITGMSMISLKAEK
jgi:hypothetical protein